MSFASYPSDIAHTFPPRSTKETMTIITNNGFPLTPSEQSNIGFVHPHPTAGTTHPEGIRLLGFDNNRLRVGRSHFLHPPRCADLVRQENITDHMSSPWWDSRHLNLGRLDAQLKMFRL